MKRAILIAMLLSSFVARARCEDGGSETPPAPVDQKKASALTQIDRAITTAKGRVASLQKSKDKLAPKIKAVKEAQDKFKQLKDAMDQAMAKLESSAKVTTDAYGKSYKTYDPAAQRASEQAQKAYNSAKLDYAGIDEQLAVLEKQEATTSKQFDDATEKLAKLEEDRAKIADGAEPTSEK